MKLDHCHYATHRVIGNANGLYFTVNYRVLEPLDHTTSTRMGSSEEIYPNNIETILYIHESNIWQINLHM